MVKTITINKTLIKINAESMQNPCTTNEKSMNFGNPFNPRLEKMAPQKS